MLISSRSENNQDSRLKNKQQSKQILCKRSLLSVIAWTNPPSVYS